MQAFADGVGRGALCQSCILDQLCVFHLAMMDAVYLKYAFCQSSCLVKYKDFCLGQVLQIVGALYKYAGFAGSSDPRKEAERDTDDQGTGAAGYQERKSAVDPCLPTGRQA